MEVLSSNFEISSTLNSAKGLLHYIRHSRHNQNKCPQFHDDFFCDVPFSKIWFDLETAHNCCSFDTKPSRDTTWMQQLGQWS